MKLISDGSEFGGVGFYRLVQIDANAWKVRFIKTLHEVIHVYLDETGVLRTDHSIKFLGLPVLRLHYKMKAKAIAVDTRADQGMSVPVACIVAAQKPGYRRELIKNGPWGNIWSDELFERTF